MTLLTVRNNLKKQYKDYVIFIKYGNFYRTFDEDTYIVWYYTYYKISNKRLGFPISEINNIIKTLSNINIIIYDNEEYKKIENINNKYNEILELSKEEYTKYTLLDKLKDYDCLNDIINISTKYGINSYNQN